MTDGEDAGAAADVEYRSRVARRQLAERQVLQADVERPLQPAGVVEVGDPVEDPADVVLGHPVSLLGTVSLCPSSFPGR